MRSLHSSVPSRGGSCMKAGARAAPKRCIRDSNSAKTARSCSLPSVPNVRGAAFGAMAVLQNHSSDQAATYRRIVGQLAIPAAFAALSDEGGIVALAYGALHNGLLCYESVITDRLRRRRGWGRRIVKALAAWARDQGAVGVCLEVEAHNAPARALYDAVGLKTELYRYHYRRESV